MSTFIALFTKYPRQYFQQYFSTKKREKHILGNYYERNRKQELVNQDISRHVYVFKNVTLQENTENYFLKIPLSWNRMLLAKILVRISGLKNYWEGQSNLSFSK